MDVAQTMDAERAAAHRRERVPQRVEHRLENGAHVARPCEAGDAAAVVPALSRQPERASVQSSHAGGACIIRNALEVAVRAINIIESQHRRVQ